MTQQSTSINTRNINQEDYSTQREEKVQYEDQDQTKNQNFQEDNYQPLQNYVISKTLGKGNFGKVKLATHKITGELVAVKILEKQLIFQKSDIVRISRQLKIMKLIRHPFVIQLYQIIQTPKQLYLIMEYAQNGDLFDKIVKLQRFQESLAAQMYAQIALGLQYLHDMGVTHRDLKPQNILIAKNNIVKIADFGLGNMFKTGQKLKTACGSPCYASPQMLNKEEYDPRKIDIWSSGIILYAMVCGYLPFEDKVTSKLYQKIKNSNYKLPSWVSNSCRNLIRGILTKDPSLRWDLQVILQHQFLLKSVTKLKETIQEKEINDQKLNQVCQKYEIQQKQRLINSLKKNKHSNLTTLYYLGLKSIQKQKNGQKKLKTIKQFQQIVDFQQQQQKIQANKNKQEEESEANQQKFQVQFKTKQENQKMIQEKSQIQKQKQQNTAIIEKNEQKQTYENQKIIEQNQNNNQIFVQKAQIKTDLQYEKLNLVVQNHQLQKEKKTQNIQKIKTIQKMNKIQEQNNIPDRRSQQQNSSSKEKQQNNSKSQFYEYNKILQPEFKHNNNQLELELQLQDKTQSQKISQKSMKQLLKQKENFEYPQHLVQQNQKELNLSNQFIQQQQMETQNQYSTQKKELHCQNLFQQFQQKKNFNIQKSINQIKTQNVQPLKKMIKLTEPHSPKIINKKQNSKVISPKRQKNQIVQQKRQNLLHPKVKEMQRPQKLQKNQQNAFALHHQRLQKSSRINQYKPQSHKQDLNNLKLYERSHSKDRPIIFKSKINKKVQSIKQKDQEKGYNMLNRKTLNDSHSSISPSSAHKIRQQQIQLKNINKLANIYELQSQSPKKIGIVGKELQSQPYLINPQRIVVCSYQKLVKVLDCNGFMGKLQYYKYDQYLYISKQSLKLSTKAIQKGMKTTLQTIINQINTQYQHH